MGVGGQGGRGARGGADEGGRGVEEDKALDSPRLSFCRSAPCRLQVQGGQGAGAGSMRSARRARALASFVNSRRGEEMERPSHASASNQEGRGSASSAKIRTGKERGAPP